MNPQLYYYDLGLIDYNKAWEIQENIHAHITDKKVEHKIFKNSGIILFCEHPHVYTLGKSGNMNNLLINNEFLEKINACFVKTNRGGDITYHGPGQVVCYPIMNLEKLNLGIKKYIWCLEQSIIDTLSEYEIPAGRYRGATGVWLDPDNSLKVRKICSIGVRVSRFVTMHGFALNVNTNLNYFGYINPCGFNNLGVTSMQRERGLNIDINIVKNSLLNNLSETFGITLCKVNEDELL